MGTTASFIVNSRTPESAILRLANDGNPDDPLPTLTRAQIEAQLLSGPLRELIHRTADLSNLNVIAGSTRADDYIRFTRVEGGLNAPIRPPNNTCVLYFTADALVFSITATVNPDPPIPTTCGLLVELRFVHSSDR